MYVFWIDMPATLVFAGIFLLQLIILILLYKLGRARP